MSNQQLANDLHKPIIRKSKRRRVYASFKDNILGVDLADMQLISKYIKRSRFLLCVFIFLVNMLRFFLKTQKRYYYSYCISNYFRQFKRKPNKIWVDQGSEFYNN